MQVKINGETPFKCLKETFTVGPTSNGYVLGYGVSKEGPFTEYETAVPANETLIVYGVTALSWFKLIGNQDEVDGIL